MRVQILEPCDVVTLRRKNGAPRAMQHFEATGPEGVTIKQDWAEELIAKGKAVEVPVPPRKPQDGD